MKRPRATGQYAPSRDPTRDPFYVARRRPVDEGWTGPVVRLADLTDAELVALGAPPRARQLRSEVLERCANPYCREWPISGSRAAGRCLLCHTPLGERPC